MCNNHHQVNTSKHNQSQIINTHYMPLPTDLSSPNKTNTNYNRIISRDELQPLISHSTQWLILKGDRWINRGDTIVLKEFISSEFKLSGLECVCVVADVRNDDAKGIEKGYTIVSLIIESIKVTPK